MTILKILVLTFCFTAVCLFPSTIDGVKVVMVNRQVSIKANKNFPPYVAFIAMTGRPAPEETAKVQKNKSKSFREIDLADEKTELDTMDPRPNLARMVLPTLRIVKESKIIYQANLSSNNDRIELDNKIDSYGNYLDPRVARQQQTYNKNDEESWLHDLKPFIRKKFGSYSDHEIEEMVADPVIETEPMVASKAELVSMGLASAAQSVLDSKSKNSTESSAGTLQASQKTSAYVANSVVGLLEIRDGLAITNEHHIEIRRYEEGSFKEKGTVNLVNGTYQLQIENPKGFILARLVTSDGRILGEGIGRVSEVVWNKNSYHTGPKININKKIDVKGKTVSAYQIEQKNASIEKGSASLFNNYLNKKIEKDGSVGFDHVVAGSSTVLVSEAKNHVPSQQIILASSEFENIIYPQKMIDALKAMVSEQRQQNLNDKNLSVIMGQVLFDKKAISGVTVEVEKFVDIEPIYFNSFMLPDKTLKVTSENGYFAFIGVPEDLHHIVAKRGENYFSHVNITVNPGVVSYAKLESSIKTETVDVKVFDAFVGDAKPAELSLQSLQEKIEVDKEGFKTIFLPSLERWSLLHANPDPNYLPAYYSYIDKTDFINVPLISRGWLNYLFSELKINIHPQSAMVIGFVHDEDFTVELPENEHLKNNILYFDYAGRITKAKNGNLGGGFILFNLPPNVYEVLVLGTKSQKIYSRLAPLKSQEAFVFNFKLDVF